MRNPPPLTQVDIRRCAKCEKTTWHVKGKCKECEERKAREAKLQRGGGI